MMERGEIGRIALRGGVLESRQIFRFGLGVARAAKIIVLLQMRRVTLAANRRDQPNRRNNSEPLPVCA